jgi:hypothetical protein
MEEKQASNQQFVGRILRNRNGKCVGTIIGIVKINGEECFEVDNPEDPGFDPYWETARLNSLGRTDWISVD